MEKVELRFFTFFHLVTGGAQKILEMVLWRPRNITNPRVFSFHLVSGGAKLVEQRPVFFSLSLFFAASQRPNGKVCFRFFHLVSGHVGRNEKS